MAISTYNELKTAIERWSKRTDAVDVIDDFIDLAEADIARELRIRDMEARATASASTADRFLELPTSFLMMRKMRLYTGSLQYDLTYRVPESMTIIPASGRPTEYTVTSQLEFNRTPDSAYTVEMQYYRSLTPLSASNTTNAILTRYPNVYLYGALFHFGLWARDDRMVAQFAPLFDGAIREANTADRKGRHGAAKAMKIEGSTP